ncbi:kinase-like domain-containing protein [Suillus discolor]|uniref:Kinase-like domain-containing protein n=1 Tax=Suillus discolor TaxID=1912936 RepID=A0A9P7EPR6_9AGAM|nr:kinase-like domain-containing protein [Suillus discolor]KAG2079613.1 kinase-like domain-containing protein [Suillus discolor]
MVCYCVRDPTDGKDYVMKDCWVPEAKRYHEVAVLKQVHGIPNVVQLVDDWDVMYDGEPDCTARIRDRYQQFDPDDRDDHRFCNRFHRQLVMTPCGEPLSHFSSRKELICAFCDFVVAHRLMVECGILHGDLSLNNFIIYEGNSYFIDFDYARFIEEGKTSTISFGTGTIPYISMRVLKKMLRNAETVKKTADATQLQQIEHYMCDDLESMFYIFFEFVTKYGGAHGIVAPTWDKLAMPWLEAYENLGASSLLTTFLSKKGAIYEGDFLMDRVSDYFSEFKPLVNEWRSQIHLTEIDTNATIIHDHIFQMLAMFIAKLEDSDEIPIPIPLPYPPPQSPTVQPTAGPSTLPRTGTTWSSTS